LRSKKKNPLAFTFGATEAVSEFDQSESHHCHDFSYPGQGHRDIFEYFNDKLTAARGEGEPETGSAPLTYISAKTDSQTH